LINKKTTYANTPNSLPILMIAGDKDPVGDNAKGVKAVFESYKNSGQEDATLKLYENARHELLNETNREEVTKDILTWLNSHL